MKWWLAGALGVAALLFHARVAEAVFPPIYQSQPPVVVQAPPPPPAPVVIIGEPDPPDPVDPPVARTPEPTTIASGVMGLIFAGGYFLRKRRK